MSRILVWSPNYAPELTGIPPLVTDACDWLAARGHAVEVVTALPNYPERTIHPGTADGFRSLSGEVAVSVTRSWLRVRPGERFVDKALYELSFTTFSAPAVARRVRRADVLLCVVPCLSAALPVPPLCAQLAPGPASFCGCKTSSCVRPAPSPTSGRQRERLIRLAGGIEAAAFRAADRVVVCSPAFSEYAANLGVEPSRIETIYNWVDLERVTAQPPREHRRPTRFLYAGNLGYTQGFETLIEASRLVGDDIELEIVGAGNMAAEVRRLAAATTNVRVSPPVPNDEYPELLASADVHVVIQRGISANANFPSKIASYLASGRPVVASISPDSTAASVLIASGGALVVPPEAPQELADAMRTLSANPGLVRELGARARAYAEEHFDRERSLAQLEAALVAL